MAFFSRRNEAETSIGHYEYYTPFFETQAGIDTCETARDYISTNENRAFLSPGFGCLTEAEIEAFRDAVIEKLADVETEICTAYHDGRMNYKLFKSLTVGVMAGMCVLPAVVAMAISSRIGGNLGVDKPGAAMWAVIAAGACADFTAEMYDEVITEMCD